MLATLRITEPLHWASASALWKAKATPCVW